MGKEMVFLPLTRKVRDTMSRSKNVRSRYQVTPDYISVSVQVRDLEGTKRSRDERARNAREVRATLRSIVHDKKVGN